jgi:hypothetical protein
MIMNKYEQIIKLVEFAKSQIGYKETGKNITKYSAYFEGTDFYNGSKGDGKTWGAEWCDIFVDYCFCNVFGMEEGREMLCQPKKSAGAGCKYSAGYYKSAGRWHTSPEVGDQIFFYVGGDINHTGIVTKVAEGKVFTVEGNADNAAKEHKFALDNKKIAGYGRPRWNEEANTIADTAPTKPEPIQKPQNEVKKSLEEIAREIIAGKWGNGTERQKKLTEAGYDYAKVQAKVNEILGKKPEASSDTFYGIVNTTKSKLNIRAGAGTNYPILGTLAKGSKVQLKNAAHGWYKLTYMNGYVSANYIKKI